MSSSTHSEQIILQSPWMEVVQNIETTLEQTLTRTIAELEALSAMSSARVPLSGAPLQESAVPGAPPAIENCLAQAENRSSQAGELLAVVAADLEDWRTSLKTLKQRLAEHTCGAI